MFAEQKSHAGYRTRSAADTWEFWVSNEVTMQYDQITATRVWEGTTARIWVDNRDYVNPTRKAAIMKMLPAIERAIDSATAATSRNPMHGIFPNDIDVF